MKANGKARKADNRQGRANWKLPGIARHGSLSVHELGRKAILLECNSRLSRVCFIKATVSSDAVSRVIIRELFVSLSQIMA